jgi:hypothetical protein
MASLDTRRALPIRAGQLTDLHLAGAACVWCAATITADDRHEVGFTGHPAIRLYGCTRCVVVLRRRLPVWPEPGSA